MNKRTSFSLRAERFSFSSRPPLQPLPNPTHPLTTSLSFSTFLESSSLMAHTLSRWDTGSIGFKPPIEFSSLFSPLRYNDRSFLLPSSSPSSHSLSLSRSFRRYTTILLSSMRRNNIYIYITIATITFRNTRFAKTRSALIGLDRTFSYEKRETP